MKKSIYSVPCTNIFGADFSWFHVDAEKSGKEEGKCLCAWGHFNYCVPRTLGECPFVWPINMWTPLAALTVSSLYFSLRCPKRYAQNGARLTSWCIPTASVTVVPVSKSAGDCPVKFVFRDVTAVELLTFLLWVFISILWVIFSSFSLAPHFHLHLFLSASFLFCGDLAITCTVGQRSRKQCLWGLCLCNPCRTTLSHIHFLLKIMQMDYILQSQSFLCSLRICLEN